MTTEDGVRTGPMSWRDVYDLVESSQGLILKAVQEVKEDVVDVRRRIRVLEGQDNFAKGRAAGHKDVLGVSRSALSIIVSIIAAGVALGSWLVK